MAWIAWRLGAAHRTALVIVLCGAIAGCAPWAWPYQHIDAPGARYFQTICRAGFGPPSRVYYPYHGIFISLDITDVVTLGLHLPEGSTAQIDGTSVHITGEGKTGPADVVIPIRATKHWGMDAPEFRQYPDPFTTPDNFGPLTGETKDGDYLWYMFVSEGDRPPIRLIPTPRGMIRGTVELPAMTINGEHYGPQVLHFEHRVHAGITPVNC